MKESSGVSRTERNRLREDDIGLDGKGVRKVVVVVGDGWNCNGRSQSS